MSLFQPINDLILCFSHPGYFGKVGMRHFHLKRNKYFCPTINLDKIWTLVSDHTRQEYKDEVDKVPVIDVVRKVCLWNAIKIVHVCRKGEGVHRLVIYGQSYTT